jgi:Arc/MetJ family transcription regulator
MTRITVDVDEELLAAAQKALGTTTKVATINAALSEIDRRRRAEEMLALWDTIEMDYTGSEKAWRYGVGRDLSPEALAEAARQGLAEAG